MDKNEDEKNSNKLKITAKVLTIVSGYLVLILPGFMLISGINALEDGRRLSESLVLILPMFEFIGLIVFTHILWSLSEGSDKSRLYFFWYWPLFIIAPAGIFYIVYKSTFPFILTTIIYVVFLMFFIRQGIKYKLKDLKWYTVREKDNVIDYCNFLRENPESNHCREANERISQINREQNIIQNIVNKIGHNTIQFGENTINISIHMGLDTTNSVVNILHGSHSNLYFFAKSLTIRVYKAVLGLGSVSTLKIKEVIVECRHGVRVRPVDGYERFDYDYPVVLFKTLLRVETAKISDWNSISDEAIEKSWVVVLNNIPNLRITSI